MVLSRQSALFLCKSARSQLKNYPGGYWECKHVRMKTDIVYSGIKILVNLDSVFVSPVRGQFNKCTHPLPNDGKKLFIRFVNFI